MRFWIYKHVLGITQVCFKVFIKSSVLGLPWQQLKFALPLQGAQVQSLVGEQRSHMPRSVATKKKKKLRIKLRVSEFLLNALTHTLKIILSQFNSNCWTSFKCFCWWGLGDLLSVDWSLCPGAGSDRLPIPTRSRGKTSATSLVRSCMGATSQMTGTANCAVRI